MSGSRGHASRGAQGGHRAGGGHSPHADLCRVTQVSPEFEEPCGGRRSVGRRAPGRAFFRVNEP